MQSSADAELQAVVAASRALSEAVLAVNDERAAAIAAATRGLSYPVLISRLPRGPRGMSPTSKVAPQATRRREAEFGITPPKQKPVSPLKLSMPAIDGPVARNPAADACGSGDWLLAAEHGSPVAQPPPSLRRA